MRQLLTSSEFAERIVGGIADLDKYWAAMLRGVAARSLSKQRLRFMTVIVAALACLWATKLDLRSRECAGLQR